LPAASFLGPHRASVIDQNPPHDALPPRQEVCAVLEGQLLLGGEPHECFVHQRTTRF
jgi:hypothetical protein